MDWVKIWSVFFFASLGLFACLSIVVTIGGFFDIRSLFKDLLEARNPTQQADESNEA
jgi:hypothetical protein